MKELWDSWTLYDGLGQIVLTPCCGFGWIEPMLVTAKCAVCVKAWDVTQLGVVRGDRKGVAA